MIPPIFCAPAINPVTAINIAPATLILILLVLSSPVRGKVALTAVFCAFTLLSWTACGCPAFAFCVVAAVVLELAALELVALELLVLLLALGSTGVVVVVCFVVLELSAAFSLDLFEAFVLLVLLFCVAFSLDSFEAFVLLVLLFCVAF